MQTPNVHNTTPETGQNSFADQVASEALDLNLASELVAFGSRNLSSAIAVAEFLESEECFLPQEIEDDVEALMWECHAPAKCRATALKDLLHILEGKGYLFNKETPEGGGDDDWDI